MASLRRFPEIPKHGYFHRLQRKNRRGMIIDYRDKTSEFLY